MLWRTPSGTMTDTATSSQSGLVPTSGLTDLAHGQPPILEHVVVIRLAWAGRSNYWQMAVLNVTALI